jgi:cell division protein FtsB
MRIKRSITRAFALSILPAVSCAVVLYFGYFAIWGERGMLALSDVQAQLEVDRARLAQAEDGRHRLEHRVQLINSGDQDIIEELSRGQLMQGAPGQVRVSRGAQGAP